MGLGKRKRRYQTASDEHSIETDPDGNAAELQALFRQHFETRFKPLEGFALPVGRVQTTTCLDEDVATDWEGLSDNEDPKGPQIIQHYAPQSAEIDIPKDELRAFMAWTPFRGHGKQSEHADSEGTGSDAANLKKDLALQRLLKESHLLDSQSDLSVSGRNRHKAMDMRLQDLGSKTSLYAQTKMPMSHRKGIAMKLAEREETRRREAQENGTILEKAPKVRKASDTRRQRSIGAPTVGKFQGGMLKLSKRDVSDIQGLKKKVKRKR